MDAQDLARYHTSAESLATELATRKAMRDSGFSDAEIDRALLVGHLQGVFLGRWLGAVLFAVLVVWLIGLISLTWAAVAAAIWVPIAFIGARISARRAASTHSWFRVHGGGWTAGARPSRTSLPL
jgi:hypothetical protein